MRRGNGWLAGITFGLLAAVCGVAAASQEAVHSVAATEVDATYSAACVDQAIVEVELQVKIAQLQGLNEELGVLLATWEATDRSDDALMMRMGAKVVEYGKMRREAMALISDAFGDDAPRGCDTARVPRRS